MSDDELDRPLILLAVLPFGQLCCERLDTENSFFNHVATDLQVDMRNHWRPDGDFLNRRRRDQLATIAKECGYAVGLSRLDTWKKTELVTGLLRHFEQASCAVPPTEAQQRARAWLPEAMRFPAVDPDAAKEHLTHDDTADDAAGDIDDLDEQAA